MKVVQVDGGMGRVICAIPALEKLAQTHDVVVLTSHRDVFENNPNIPKVYSLDREYLWDDVISKGTFQFPEPYYNEHYYNQKHHLIESFFFLLTGKSKYKSPSIYLSEDEKIWAKELIFKIKKDTGKERVLAFQPFGAAMRIAEWGASDPTHRSLSREDALYLVDKVSKDSNYVFLNCTFMPANHPNIWQQQLNTRQLLAVASECDKIVTVDSSLNHIGAAFNKPGILILGATYKENVGYAHYKTFQRPDFPANYHPNRFTCAFVDKNHDAMKFSQQNLDDMVKAIVD